MYRKSKTERVLSDLLTFDVADTTNYTILTGLRYFYSTKYQVVARDNTYILFQKRCIQETQVKL